MRNLLLAAFLCLASALFAGPQADADLKTINDHLLRKASGKWTWVFYGDSITHGAAHTKGWRSFPEIFTERVRYELGLPYDVVVNTGISGQTSVEVLCRFRQDVVAHHPKVVVMMIGTNDVAQNIGAISDECYLNNVASACDIAKANGIKMLLCSIPPCDFFPWRSEMTPGPEVIRLNGKLREYAEAEGIQYVDYFSILNNGKDGMIPEYTSDHCHPTPLGYNVMERFVVKEINKALGTDKAYFVTE